MEKLYEVLKKYDITKEDYNINDIIEFFNITMYIENECFLIKWTKDEIDKIKSQLPELKKR